MVDVSQIMDAIVAVSIAAGALFAIVELRQMTKDRKTQLVITLMDKRGSREFTELSDKIWKTEFRTGEEASEKCGEAALNEMSNFYEQVGLLIDEKLVDKRIVFESIGIDPAWQKLKPWCLWTRSKCECGPRSWEHFEEAARKDREYEANKKHYKTQDSCEQCEN